VAKEQKRGNREIRKPKTAKAPTAPEKLAVTIRAPEPIALPKRRR
jgi:hypothetical protein